MTQMAHSTVGSVLRSTQAYCGQLCENETLECGIAYYNESFALLPEANQFREVLIENPARAPHAIDQAERFFKDKGLTCYRWAMAMAAPSEAIEKPLIGAGFQRRDFTAMRLARWVDLTPAPDIRILHARSVRQALRDSFLKFPVPNTTGLADSPTTRDCLARAHEQRLDDPQFDMFVALHNGEPVGRCALYQVGDIARIMDLTMLPTSKPTDANVTLTAHLLAMAHRLAMRNIVTLVDDRDASRRDWFISAGFVPDGTIVEFHRPAQAAAP